MQTRNQLIVAALSVLVGFGSASQAAASMAFGEFLGVFKGNDSENSIMLDLGLEALGLEAIRLDRVETPHTTSDDLSITVLATKDDNEPIGGEWDYVGLSKLDLIVVKAGNMYAVYRYDGAVVNPTSSSGLWDTSQLDNKELSHLTAYGIIPEPTTAVLLVVGFTLLALVSSPRKNRSGPSS